MKLTDKYSIIYCLSVMILLSGCAAIAGRKPRNHNRNRQYKRESGDSSHVHVETP